MKAMSNPKKGRKLTLKKEVVRKLSPGELDRARGGGGLQVVAYTDPCPPDRLTARQSGGC
jgi:hypothetical protein